MARRIHRGLHGAEHDIQTLKQNVISGINFTNVTRKDTQVPGTEDGAVVQSVYSLPKLTFVGSGNGKFIQQNAQPDRFGTRASVTDIKGMFDKRQI